MRLQVARGLRSITLGSISIRAMSALQVARGLRSITLFKLINGTEGLLQVARGLRSITLLDQRPRLTWSCRLLAD